MVLEDPLLFRSDLSKRYFSHFRSNILGRKPALMYDEIIDMIESPSTDNLVVIASRGHGKTQLLSIDYPLWKCYSTSDKKLTITISSASLDQSRLIVEDIQHTVMNNPYLSKVLEPDFKHDTKWNAQRITTKFGHRIICIPFGSTARGKHCDLSILDDVLKREVSNVEYAKSTFWSDVFPITKAKRGKHLVVGTPQYYNDLLADLKGNSLFRCLEFPAVVTDAQGNWLSAQCPEMFSLDVLGGMRDNMPRHSWMSEYMLVPMSDGDLLFPHEVVLSCVRQSNVEVPKGVFFGALDVAVSETGDSCVFTVGVAVGDEIFVLFSEAHKGWSTLRQLDHIKELNRRFKFSKFVVEDNGVGQGVVSVAKEDGGLGFCSFFNTTRGDKQRILGQVEVLLRQKKLSLPDDSELMKELTTIGLKRRGDKWVLEALSGHDDRVMSLAMLVDVAMLRGSAGLVFV